MHAARRQASEPVALSSDGAAEAAALDESFTALLGLQWQLIVRRGWLNLVTFFCEYMGSIVNYAAIGLVLCSGP